MSMPDAVITSNKKWIRPAGERTFGGFAIKDAFLRAIRRRYNDGRPVCRHKEGIVPDGSPQFNFPSGRIHDDGRRNGWRKYGEKVLRRRSIVVAGLLFVRIFARVQFIQNRAERIEFVAGVEVALQGEVQSVIFIPAFDHIVKLFPNFKTLLFRV